MRKAIKQDSHLHYRLHQHPHGVHSQLLKLSVNKIAMSVQYQCSEHCLNELFQFPDQSMQVSRPVHLQQFFSHVFNIAIHALRLLT